MPCAEAIEVILWIQPTGSVFGLYQSELGQGDLYNYFFDHLR